MRGGETGDSHHTPLVLRPLLTIIAKNNINITLDTHMDHIKYGNAAFSADLLRALINSQ